MEGRALAQRASKKLDARLERVVKIAEAKDAVIRAAIDLVIKSRWRIHNSREDRALIRAVARLEKLEGK